MIDTMQNKKALLSQTSFNVLLSSVNNNLSDENHFSSSIEEESKEFIKKLLQEDEKALANLREQREAESVFICKICYEQLDGEEGE
jgi:molecular chaperone DnaK (HSP70)